MAATQQRLVLAVLLAAAGQIVSTERLVDTIWADHAPRRAVNTAQAYIMRLRRLVGADLIVTRAHGYELAAGRDDIDATVFVRLVAEARSNLADGRLHQGAALMADALALWHGPVLADVPPNPLLEPHAAYLEQMRLTVQEDHLSALLEVGRHGQVVDELYRLVLESPLRERRWVQLMTALDRSGRRAEALEAYRRAYRVLREELGTEPGPRLRELHRNLLAG